mmetsp:Transcript_20440/g.47947  ORF Transcript_20440/g.47947 Transcript_20440/m.47947 type:complete len:96 (+) Transcript_20440:58-345(+)
MNEWRKRIHGQLNQWMNGFESSEIQSNPMQCNTMKYNAIIQRAHTMGMRWDNATDAQRRCGSNALGRCTAKKLHDGTSLGDRFTQIFLVPPPQRK